MSEWTAAQLTPLRELFPNMETAQVAEVLGFPLSRVQRKAYALGLCKSPEYRAAKLSELMGIGAAFRFDKGIVAHNKGVKMPETTYLKVAPTMFKKGRENAKRSFIGYERIDKDGYIEVKTEKGFKKKQRHIWEQAFGEIPANHNVIFLDGDNRNFSLNNLAIISKADNARRNAIKYSPEYKEVLGLLKQLKNKIKDAEKQLRGLA